jgi:hypothetical protein
LQKEPEMKKAGRIICVAGLTMLTSACAMSVPVTLYPVQGPYTQKNPKPVITATTHDVQRNTGKFEVVLPSGEKCSGQWSSAAGIVVTTGSVSLFTQYGHIAGFGTAVSNVPGTNKGQAISFCQSGTTLEAEFVTGSGTANGFGVAKDSDGNVYKMLF